jgi:hypothetical protein
MKLRTELEEISMSDNNVLENRQAINPVWDKSDHNIFREMKEDFDKIDSFKKGSGARDWEQRDEDGNSLMLADPQIDRKLLTEPRKMSSVQMNDLILELLESKVKTDIKNIESLLPKKTMEFHMQDIFKNKFGLKNIVTETMSSFLFSLKHFAPTHSRASVFLSILKNECEEEFFYAVKSIESSLVCLLKVPLYLTDRCSCTATPPMPRRSKSTKR